MYVLLCSTTSNNLLGKFHDKLVQSKFLFSIQIKLYEPWIKKDYINEEKRNVNTAKKQLHRMRFNIAKVFSFVSILCFKRKHDKARCSILFRNDNIVDRSWRCSSEEKIPAKAKGNLQWYFASQFPFNQGGISTTGKPF